MRALTDTVNANVDVQWSPDAAVRFSHPLAGNQAAIGLDLRTDPRSGDRVRQIIASGKAAWDGPLQHRQGGIGLIYGSPIYRDSSAPSVEGFAGLATSLVNLTN